ncbi:hypothetical protein RJ639_025271 [Escallonia herrerae]|uniref:SHSP domain-containing protein n=1 Tax=Escallonia herrerae TaxID=1293975 RepID=A0AA88UTQ1_9ASTE|nr:hypothetical protein RJ639_025271 [Escallonia herrerae]
MEARLRAAPNRVYQELDPLTEWVAEEACDTLLLHLPGFKKEQLRVQLTTSRNLIISGERQLRDNTWSRFRKELPVSANCDVNSMSAKYELGILFIRQPKLITPAENQDREKPVTEAPKPLKPLYEPEPRKKVTEEASQKPAPAPTPATRSNGDATESPTAKKVPEKTLEKEKDPKSTDGERRKSAELGTASEKSSEKEKTDAEVVSGKAAKEERSAGSAAKNGKKQVSESVNEATKEDGLTREVDDGRKTALGSDTNAVGGTAAKLKMPRKMINLVLYTLIALGLGFYVANSVREFQAHNNPLVITDGQHYSALRKVHIWNACVHSDSVTKQVNPPPTTNVATNNHHFDSYIASNKHHFTTEPLPK